MNHPTPLTAESLASLQKAGLVFPTRPAFSRQECTSGLYWFRSVGSQPEPVRIVRRLAQACPLHLLVDFNRLGQPMPESLPAPDYLFDWLAKVVVEQTSPVWLSSGAPVDPLLLLQQGWGKDALICLFSRLKGPALLDRLRAAARPSEQDDQEPAGEQVLGIGWPSVLGSLLAYRTEEFVHELTTGIEAVFIEADAPGSWQAYSGKGFARPLEQLGLIEVPIEEQTDKTGQV